MAGRGFGTGYAQGLRSVGGMESATGLVDKPSAQMTGAGQLLSGAAQFMGAQKEQSELERLVKTDESAGNFLHSLFGKMIEFGPKGKPTGKLKQPFRAEGSDRVPRLDALTAAFLETAFEQQASPDTIGAVLKGLVGEGENVGGAFTLAPNVAKQIYEVFEKQHQIQMQKMVKEGAEAYKSAAEVDGLTKKEALTMTGIPSGPAVGEAVDLTKQAMEAIAAEAAGKGGKGATASYKLYNPATNQYMETEWPVGMPFNPPAGWEVTDPKRPLKSTEPAAKAAMGIIFVKNYTNLIRPAYDELFTNVGGLAAKKNMGVLKMGGYGNPRISELHGALEFGVEGFLRDVSGAAIPPDEVKKGMRFFLPNPLKDDAESAIWKLDQLRAFHAITLSNMDPTGQYVNLDAVANEIDPTGELAKMDSAAKQSYLLNIFLPSKMGPPDEPMSEEEKKKYAEDHNVDIELMP